MTIIRRETKLPIPDLRLDSVYELRPEMLTKLGIRLLLLDLDNTLSPYGQFEPDKQLRDWLDSLVKAGIMPHLFSNNRSGRPLRFAESLGIGATDRAKKPNPRILLRLLREKGVKPSEAALCGDQVYTDIFCAKRAGILALAVRPISIKKPHRAIRYALEAPFRLAGKKG